MKYPALFENNLGTQPHPSLTNTRNLSGFMAAISHILAMPSSSSFRPLFPTIFLLGLAGLCLSSATTALADHQSTPAPVAAAKTPTSSTSSPADPPNVFHDLPHVFQGERTTHCGIAVVTTALQADTGLSLSVPGLVQQLAGIVSRKLQTSSQGCSPRWVLPYFNIRYTYEDFNQQLKIADRKSARPLALSILREKIIPQIQSGSFYALQIHTGGDGHAILLTEYNKSEDTLVVYDPVRHEKHSMTVKAVSDIWPVTYPEATRKKYNYISEDRVYLSAEQISTSRKTTFSSPPLDCELRVEPSLLGDFIISKDLKSIPDSGYQLRKNVQGSAYWQLLSKGWENDRTPDEVPGVAALAKIKVAEGKPVLVVQSGAEGSYRIAAVTGYKGGIANPEAQIQLTTCSSGKLASTWISGKEFAQSCFPKLANGRFSAFVGFPSRNLCGSNRPTAPANPVAAPESDAPRQ